MGNIMTSLISLMGVGVIVVLVKRAFFSDKADGYFNYFVRFEDTNSIPDIAENPNLKNKLQIISCRDGVYVVLSKINDAKIKEILMTDYHLTPRQVVVQTGAPAPLHAL